MSILNIINPASFGNSSPSDIYSTEEVRIGTWIDKKPLYRKCWNVSGTEDAPWSMAANAPSGTNVSKVVKFQHLQQDDFDLIFNIQNRKRLYFLNESSMWITPYITSAYVGFIINVQFAGFIGNGDLDAYAGLGISATKYVSSTVNLPTVFTTVAGTLVLEYTKTTDQPETT